MSASKKAYYSMTLFLIFLLPILCIGCEGLASREAKVVRTYEYHIDESDSFKDTKEIVIIKDSEGNVMDRYEKKAVFVTKYRYNYSNPTIVSKAKHDTYVDIGNGRAVLTRKETDFNEFGRPFSHQDLYPPEGGGVPLGSYSLDLEAKLSDVMGIEVFYSKEQEKDRVVLKRSFYNYYNNEILDALDMYSGDPPLMSIKLSRDVGDAGDIGDIFDMGDEYLLFRKEVWYSFLDPPDMEYFLPPEGNPFFETHTLLLCTGNSFMDALYKDVTWSINEFSPFLPSEVYRYDGENLILMDIPSTGELGKESVNVRDVNIIFRDDFTTITVLPRTSLSEPVMIENVEVDEVGFTLVTIKNKDKLLPYIHGQMQGDPENTGRRTVVYSRIPEELVDIFTELIR